MLKGGIAYLLIAGVVWVDDTTQVSLSEWLAASDPMALTWRAGDRATGWTA